MFRWEGHRARKKRGDLESDQMEPGTSRGKPFTFTFQTEEEASLNTKEKMSTDVPPTHGHDIHVTRDLVTDSLWGSGGDSVW